MAQPKRQIAVIVSTSTTYGRQIMQGIGKFARARGGWSFYVEAWWEVAPFPSLRQCDGIIAHFYFTKLNRAMLDSGRPVVNVSAVRVEGVPQVIPEDRAIGRLVAQHFIERGFTSLAFCGFAGREFSDDRRDGFAEALKDAGLDCAVCETSAGGRDADETWDQQQQRLAEWIRGLPRPVAIMACNDVRGRHVVDTCRSIGIAVPEQVAVVGVDNDDLICEFADPPLSSVALGGERMGYAAAEMLDSMLNGEPPPTQPVRIAPQQIVTRQSSDILAIADQQVAAAVRYIREHAGELMQVQDVVDNVAVARRTLEMRFKQVLGRSPAAEIRRAHIDLAKQLLTQTDLPIPRVAAASGFANAARLNEAFGRDVKMSPSAFRRQFRLR